MPNTRIQAGELNKYGALQQKDKTSISTAGQRDIVWEAVDSTLNSVPMAIRPLTARERTDARTYVAGIEHIVTIRFPDPGIVTVKAQDHSILFEGRRLFIKGVRNVKEENVFLLLDCGETE